jgi:hypothetical protein
MLGHFCSRSRMYTDTPPPLGITQGLAPACLKAYQRTFGRLKRLRIALPRTVHRDSGVLDFCGLSALIRSADVLQELWFSFGGHCDHLLLPSFLVSLSIPHLRTLVPLRQSRTVLSEADAMSAESGENVTELTASLWPSRISKS